MLVIEPVRLLASVVLAGLLLWGCGSALERRLIYYPSRRLEGTPKDVRLSYEGVTFTTEDGLRLHGWYLPGNGPWTLLWFHGNAGNISHRLENIRLFHDRLGLSVFIFDYRGYGLSQGHPSEQGLYRDAKAALAILRQRFLVEPQQLLYFGRSLGAAVAVELAVTSPPAGLILESPFPSIQAIANQTLWGTGYLLRSRFNAQAKIGRIHTPLLILHGDDDEVIPHPLGQRLFAAANQPKAFYTIRGANHNDTYLVGGAAYWQAWQQFLLRLQATGLGK